MYAKLKYNQKIIQGEFAASKGKTGIPPYRRIFKTLDNKEYYPEQIEEIKNENSRQNNGV